MKKNTRLKSLYSFSGLTVLPNKVGHYTFLSKCTSDGKNLLPICRDAETVNRAAVHKEVGEMAFKFFRKHL